MWFLLCQDIVELRRGDHSGARLNLERERERTEEVVVAHFKRWAKNPQGARVGLPGLD